MAMSATGIVTADVETGGTLACRDADRCTVVLVWTPTAPVPSPPHRAAARRSQGPSWFRRDVHVERYGLGELLVALGLLELGDRHHQVAAAISAEVTCTITNTIEDFALRLAEQVVARPRDARRLWHAQRQP